MYSTPRYRNCLPGEILMPDDTYHGHPTEDIEEGEKLMQSPVTDTIYLVTKWVHQEGEHFVALEKTEFDLRERPHPRTMALSCIWDEASRLGDLWDGAPSNVRDELTTRFKQMDVVLNARLDIDYPDCPRCGRSSLSREYDGVVTCDHCRDALPEQAAHEYEEADRKLWGRRGHGGAD